MFRWERMLNFKARASRREVLILGLFYCAVALLLTGIFIVTGPEMPERAINEGWSWIGVSNIALIALFVLFMSALVIRRLHDLDLGWWMLLLGFVPYLGPFILLGILFSGGTPGPNSYGPDPRFDGVEHGDTYL